MLTYSNTVYHRTVQLVLRSNAALFKLLVEFMWLYQLTVWPADPVSKASFCIKNYRARFMNHSKARRISQIT